MVGGWPRERRNPIVLGNVEAPVAGCTNSPPTSPILRGQTPVTPFALTPRRRTAPRAVRARARGASPRRGEGRAGPGQKSSAPFQVARPLRPDDAARGRGPEAIAARCGHWGPRRGRDAAPATCPGASFRPTWSYIVLALAVGRSRVSSERRPAGAARRVGAEGWREGDRICVRRLAWWRPCVRRRPSTAKRLGPPLSERSWTPKCAAGAQLVFRKYCVRVSIRASTPQQEASSNAEALDSFDDSPHTRSLRQ